MRTILILFLFASLSFAQITTVVSNRGGSGGGGEPPAGAAIEDDFSTDTSSDYTAITGGISISGGTAGGSTNWANNIVYHETSLGSDDHYVQADISTGTSSNAGSLILRCNGTTGYRCMLADNERLYLHSFTGTTYTYVGYWSITGTLTDDYLVRVQVSGSTFTAWIDLNGDDDFEDANESLGNQTSSTYSSGSYIGLGFDRGSGTDHRADNLEADTL